MTDEEWDAEVRDPKPPHGWWHGWKCLPHNSDIWISEDRNHQRINRPRRHDGHHRGHHDRTPAQRFARYDRILYPERWPRPREGNYMKDAYGIVANVTDDKILRIGALVWIHYANGGDPKRPIVTGMSKGGRIIQKYMNIRGLENFRAKWIPDHMHERVIWQFSTQEEAALFAAKLRPD